ncbi:MAG: plastocyanin/azurin family copper-binding protein [Acidimicrobiia bacterium]
MREKTKSALLKMTAATALVAAPLTLVACGGGSSDSSGSSSGSATATGAVVVQAKDNFYDKKSYSAKAGDVTFDFVLKGVITHDLQIKGDDAFKLEVTPQAEKVSGTLKLEPGTYTLYCSQPGHEATMTAKLTVT